MRKLGISLGVLIIVAAVVGIVTWVYWQRGERLAEEARGAYYEGKAVNSLAQYRTLEEQYPSSWQFFEPLKLQASYHVPELEAFLRAADLQDGGQVGEAIAAYESFLDEYEEKRQATHVYLSRAREALVKLKLEQALALQNETDYNGAMEVYQSLLAWKTLGEPECAPRWSGDSEGAACQQADMAIEENHTRAQAAIPAVFREWAGELEQQKNYQEYIERYRAMLEAYPSTLNQEEMRTTLAEVYSAWAVQLRQAEDYERAIEQYQVILEEFADTPAAIQAQGAMAETREELAAWREATRAVPAIDFPQEISRDADGHWSWTTVFKESDGKVGYTLGGEGWIVDVEGHQYGPAGSIITRGSVTVSAGGLAEDSYWCEGDIFADGHAIFAWSGQDATGHAITIEEKVHLLP